MSRHPSMAMMPGRAALSLSSLALGAALLAAACGGGSDPEPGDGARITDPARVPSSTPITNPTLYKIQGNQVTLSGGDPTQLTPVAGVTPASKTTYTVEPGDTCFAIASNYGVSTDALSNANPGLCDNLTAGDVLTIPEAPKTPTVAAGGLTSNPTVRATPTAGARTPTPAAGSGNVYVVKSGDTCDDIAASYGVTVDEIIAANGLDADCSLQIDQEIAIP